MLDVTYCDISDIKPYSKNAKLHTKDQIEQIKKSIELYGFNDPIALWKDNTIIEGHGRFEAAIELGLNEVPVIHLDELDDKQRREYMLVHNQLTMNTDFDLYKLDMELRELDFDGFDFGFDEPFNMDDIEEVDGYDEHNDDREFFSAAFTFPIGKREQILKYLRKHKNEITEEIIEKASE